MEELRSIVRQLSSVVSTIDAPQCNILSTKYGEVADRVESKVMNTLKNYTYNEMHKVLKELGESK